MLVRAGSLLPLVEEDRLILHVYAPLSGTGGGQLYSDAGDGYGPWRLDRFAMQRDGEALTVEWETEGDYPLPYSAVEVCLHGVTASQVSVDGEPLPAPGQQFTVPPFQHLRVEVEGDCKASVPDYRHSW